MKIPSKPNQEKSRVLILGAGGQDGFFLSSVMKDIYEVYAHSRVESQRLQGLGVHNLFLDIKKEEDIQLIIEKINPQIVVNFLSLSSVYECEKNESLSYALNYNFVKVIIQSIENIAHSADNPILLLQASSSEMFGKSKEACDENTDLKPVSIYGTHKAMAHEYLESIQNDQIKIQRAILFNHESELRPNKFVSQKIATAAALFRLGFRHELTLGNINATRDWGYAPEYMQAVLAMIDTQDEATFVISSGEVHSILTMLGYAFQSDDETFIKKQFVEDKNLIRDRETHTLQGNSTRILQTLGWKATISLAEIMELMISAKINEMSKK